MDLQESIKRLNLPKDLSFILLHHAPQFKLEDLVFNCFVILNRNLEDIAPTFKEFSEQTIITKRQCTTSYPEEYAGFFLEVHDTQSEMSFFIPSEPTDIEDENELMIKCNGHIPSKESLLSVLHEYGFTIEDSDITSFRLFVECDILDLNIIPGQNDKFKHFHLKCCAHTDIDNMSGANYQELSQKILALSNSSFENITIVPNEFYWYC